MMNVIQITLLMEENEIMILWSQQVGLLNAASTVVILEAG